jgi:hypothetical protein
MTSNVDPKLIKLVRQADEERQRRIRAEQQTRAYQMQNARLRRQLQSMSTRDGAPRPEADLR